MVGEVIPRSISEMCVDESPETPSTSFRVIFCRWRTSRSRFPRVSFEIMVFPLPAQMNSRGLHAQRVRQGVGARLRIRCE